MRAYGSCKGFQVYFLDVFLFLQEEFPVVEFLNKFCAKGSA
jgi:hypothetical protein